jgi:subtilase family serine protease
MLLSFSNSSVFAQQHTSKLRFHNICNVKVVDLAHCKAIQIDTNANGVKPNASSPSGFNPADLQSAYNLPSASAGSGQTVAIVDAYDDPNAESDLAVYRSQFGLPACTTANGCFKKVSQSGGTSYPSADAGWAEEISLDLDMVSAICPNCHILLVEAKSTSFTNLGKAVNTAVSLGANTVSNSYGGSESSGETSYASYYNHPGHIITASSGDDGYGVEVPAAYNTLVAVGGTSLSKSSNSRGWSETAWNDAGSGCSAYISKPSWQTDSGCSKRTVADVSAVADPNTGVSVYDTYGNVGGWLVFGGTSVSSPIIASVYALAGNASSVNAASSLYSNTGSLFDVTSGSNGSCGGSYLCTAGPGYDGPTGLGTPNGTGAF